MNSFDFGDSHVLVCAHSTAEIHHFQQSIAPASAVWVEFILGVDPLTKLDDVDMVVLLAPNASATGEMLLKQVRRQFSLLEMPVLLLAEHAEDGVSKLIPHANDFVLGRWEPHELRVRLSKLLQVRQQFLETAALNVKLHGDLHERSAKLKTLIDNGLLMSATRDVSQLFSHALWEGKRLLHCDACSLYLLTPQNTLRFAMRTKDDALPVDEIPLYDADSGAANAHYISVYAAVHRKSVVVDDVYRESRFDLSGTKAFDRATDYKTVSVLTVPMASRGGAVSGVFQFINRMDTETGAIVPFPPGYVSLVEALAAQAAVTYENLQLLDERRAFTESLIQTIAWAIDAKGPSAGRHSERVPELALMLARAAHDSDLEPFSAFKFASEEAWHEFRVGAWLHDCGKITTPEWVIHKSTKLETIYNRLHEVRMRFEVLLRDAQIERLRAVETGGPDAIGPADQKFQQRQLQLFNDFQFLAQCNVGSRAMADADMRRIREIARATWVRHFDDRLGLGPQEFELRSRDGINTLPCVEPLLADAAHHLVERAPMDLHSADHDFQMDMPQYLYNLGELHNLTVRQGTLTDEEYYKIKEHMVHGIMMLERMPFPDSLKRVPEYAGTHHETLNGSGYPRRLDASQLSIPARIMAIADIFEALTASDRPHKTPNKFSEAIQILHALKLNGQIDPDLFDLFLTSGVHQQFAHKFLHPDQCDAVDIRAYVG